MRFGKLLPASLPSAGCPTVLPQPATVALRPGDSRPYDYDPSSEPALRSGAGYGAFGGGDGGGGGFGDAGGGDGGGGGGF